MQNYTENSFAEFWMDQGILFCIYKSMDSLTEEAAKQTVADRLKVQRETPYPVFCDIQNIKKSDIHARHYLAVEGAILTKAVAFLVNPSPTRDLVDFYLYTRKPKVPTEVFEDKTNAIEFLKPYRHRRYRNQDEN